MQVHFLYWNVQAEGRIVRVLPEEPETSMKLHGWYLGAALIVAPAVALADAVLDWNEIGVATVLAARQGPPGDARSMAMMHVAMFNAVNAIDLLYTPYRAELRAPAGASVSAAAAAAAHTVLVRLFPERRETLGKAYAASLKQISGERGVEAGVALGEQAGNDLLALRANDGVGVANVYRPATSPGVYVPTTMPAGYDWREVKPWFMTQPSQFRPEAPPLLTSAIWARDYNEVKEAGGLASQKRTAEQTEVARFWTATGATTWNPVVRSLATSKPRTLVQNARLFALANMAATDAYIAVFDGKYAFNFWRPVTAVRNGESDGNDATTTDVAWLPLVETPMHPEYPCAHCITASAVATVLEAEFGTGRVSTIVMTSPTLSGVRRRWERLWDYVKEVGNARVWGGIHYRNSTEIGERMGKEIGRLAVTSAMQPAQ
ncbi:MAG: vanadium-dependent haloperoxidase [Burkholderiales bacterium]